MVTRKFGELTSISPTESQRSDEQICHINMEHVFHNTKQTRAQFELVNPAFWLARKTVFWNKQRAVITADTIGVTLPSGASAAARAICTSPTLARSALKQFIKPEDWPPMGCILQKTIDSWWISQKCPGFTFAPHKYLYMWNMQNMYIYFKKCQLE